ncbi:MAG: patatin-like phospholipase family protein [Bdellovibrio sp.]|nr:patatin-like phospholipase family protein [Bdellovibrio sp.]
MGSNIGLVLSGGGARAAYQAGVLVAIADICKELRINNPFDIYTGVSAGAINASILATHADGFDDSSRHLHSLWSQVKSEDVFISNALSLAVGGMHWLADLSLGGMTKPPGKSLLNTSPLRDLILKHCDFENIQKKIDNGVIRGFGVSALDFHTSSTVTFIQGIEEVPVWERVRRQGQKAKITVDHIMASAAIPVLFPPIAVGDHYYGDGSIRNYSPCGPAIYMGAERILAIGVRRRQDKCFTSHETAPLEAPSVARVASILLHAIMSDGIEFDMERIERINLGLSKLSTRQIKDLSVRPIQALWISPSRDFSEIASSYVGELPRMIRYLLRGLGELDESSELTSFLLFEKKYCETLMEIGFEDAQTRKADILAFLCGEHRVSTSADIPPT